MYAADKKHSIPYPDEHQAIIDRKTWDAAQALLKENLVHDGRHVKRLTPLRGLVKCGCCGGPMIENFTRKTPEKSYRYFICGHDAKRLHSTCPVKRVPAAELESLLLSEIGTMLAKPEIIAGIMYSAAELDENGKRLKFKQVQTALSDLVKVWDVMFPVERYKFIRTIIMGVIVCPDKVTIEYNTQGLESVIAETEGK